MAAVKESTVDVKDELSFTIREMRGVVEEERGGTRFGRRKSVVVCWSEERKGGREGRDVEACGGRVGKVDGGGGRGGGGGKFVGYERVDRKPTDERAASQTRPLEEEESSTDAGEDGFFCSTEFLGGFGPEVDVDWVEVREEGEPVGGGETVEEGSGDGEGIESDGCGCGQSWRKEGGSVSS